MTTLSNYNILALLKTNNAFPRKGKGVKLVRGKKEWRCYYLATGRSNSKCVFSERRVACWKYAHLHVGGQFKSTKAIYDKFPDVFESLTRSKYNAAIIVSELSKILNLDIQNTAVDAAISEIQSVTSTFCNNVDIVKNLFLKNKCTLVAHPVSYHYDVFPQGKSSLENKLCFKFARNDGGYDIGRGGNGLDTFVFAILDWTACQKNQRKENKSATVIETITSGEGTLIVKTKLCK